MKRKEYPIPAAVPSRSELCGRTSMVFRRTRVTFRGMSSSSCKCVANTPTQFSESIASNTAAAVHAPSLEDVPLPTQPTNLSIKTRRSGKMIQKLKIKENSYKFRLGEDTSHLIRWHSPISSTIARDRPSEQSLSMTRTSSISRANADIFS